MVAHGFLAALTYALSGYLRDELGTTDMNQMGGLLRRLPFIGTVMMIAMLAGCGLPGFAGFPGELLVLFGSWERSELIAGLAIWGALVIAGVYMLRGIRENAQRMVAIGAPTRGHIRTIYTIAAFIAGIAGALLTQTTETVSLEVLGFQRSADVLVMLILGGTGRLYGGLIGAAVYMVARDHFSGLNPQYWYFWIGLLLIAVVMFLPNGILGGLTLLAQRLRLRS